MQISSMDVTLQDSSSDAVALSSVRSTRQTERLWGFLVLGINAHRAFDDEQKVFVRLLSRQIETQLSSIFSLVKERISAQLNAQKSEHEQILLATQLEQQVYEARRSELRFLRFTEQAPASSRFPFAVLSDIILSRLAFTCLGADGGVRFVNEAWLKLAGINKGTADTHSWRFKAHPDDMERFDEQ